MSEPITPPATRAGDPPNVAVGVPSYTLLNTTTPVTSSSLGVISPNSPVGAVRVYLLASGPFSTRLTTVIGLLAATVPSLKFTTEALVSIPTTSPGTTPSSVALLVSSVAEITLPPAYSRVTTARLLTVIGAGWMFPARPVGCTTR